MSAGTSVPPFNFGQAGGAVSGEQSTGKATATTSVRSITVIVKFALDRTAQDYMVRESYLYERSLGIVAAASFRMPPTSRFKLCRSLFSRMFRRKWRCTRPRFNAGS